MMAPLARSTKAKALWDCMAPSKKLLKTLLLVTVFGRMGRQIKGSEAAANISGQSSLRSGLMRIVSPTSVGWRSIGAAIFMALPFSNFHPALRQSIQAKNAARMQTKPPTVTATASADHVRRSSPGPASRPTASCPWPGSWRRSATTRPRMSSPRQGRLNDGIGRAAQQHETEERSASTSTRDSQPRGATGKTAISGQAEAQHRPPAARQEQIPVGHPRARHRRPSRRLPPTPAREEPQSFASLMQHIAGERRAAGSDRRRRRPNTKRPGSAQAVISRVLPDMSTAWPGRRARDRPGCGMIEWCTKRHAHSG